ncbi:MAG: lipoprotein-releasing ABC transporter permease subunit [Gammaproteobacteria bacterium]|nr:lipoprotein-releasing ABC transporter permease subunit [Gammaproteobacteria bacterium]
MAAETRRSSAIGPLAASSFAAWMALRYVSVGRRSQLVSFMSLLTISGLALGITILITVLSVMNGFDREVRENILGILPHATVKAQERQTPEQWRPIQALLDANPRVLATAPLIEATGVLAVPGYSKGVLVNGIDPEQEGRISILDRFMLSGSLAGLTDGRFNIVLGATLAENLGVGLGDKVSLYSLNVSVNPLVPLPTQRQFTVAGIYRVGTLELDSAMAMITLQDAQALYRYRDSYTGLRFRIDDLFAVREVRAELQEQLSVDFEVQTWMQLFGNIYENIQFSRTIVGFLLWLLVGVAAFNLVVSLIMIVRDKRGDIAILRTLGASPQTIGRIFMTQGCVVGLIGTGLGVAFGVFFALTISDIAGLIESILGVKLLSAEVYPVDFLPSQILLSDIVGVSVGVFLLSVLATLYPAYRASQVQPAEALRFE